MSAWGPTGTLGSGGSGADTQTIGPGDSAIAHAATDTISAVRFSPGIETKFVAASSWDGEVRCWQMGGKRHGLEFAPGTMVLTSSTKMAGPVLCLGYGRDESVIFAGGADRTAIMWNPEEKTPVVVAQHAAPIKELFWLDEHNILVTASWDKSLSYWDPRTKATPVVQCYLPEKVNCMDVMGPMGFVAMADRRVAIIDFRRPNMVAKFQTTPLKMQLRTIGAFVDQTGYCVGSIEGRCALQYIDDDAARSKNFAYKCHRQNTTDVYCVNAISFHPRFNTFSTAGADGVINFWDKDAKQRLKAHRQLDRPVTATCFNESGELFAYALGYDWHKGVHGLEKYKNAPDGLAARLVVHQVVPADIRPKNRPAIDIRRKDARPPLV